MWSMPLSGNLWSLVCTHTLSEKYTTLFIRYARHLSSILLSRSAFLSKGHTIHLFIQNNQAWLEKNQEKFGKKQVKFGYVV